VSGLVKAYQRIVLYIEYGDHVRVHAEEMLNAVLEARKIVSGRFGDTGG
jgi:hypothetical protein